MKRIFCLLAFFFCAFLVFDVSAQGEYAAPLLFWSGTSVREKPIIMSL